MGVKILVATPIRSFGELISQVLQEVGYYPLLVADVANALDASRVETFTLAIIDCKMPPPGTEFLAAALHDQISDLRLLFLHPDDSCHDTISLDPRLDIKLPQPFYLPDLLATVEEMLDGQDARQQVNRIPTQPTEIPSELLWLKDVNRAAQYLTLLSLEADAQAALIIRFSKIWAYAGELPQSGVEELAGLIGQHWAKAEISDLARFVRLQTTGTEFMLYATGLGAGFVLTLAFETETPFSKMRAQAGELAQKLVSPLPDLSEVSDRLVKPKKKSSQSKQAALPDIDDFSPHDWVPEDSPNLTDEEDMDADDAMLARQTAMFEELLASIDIPDPDGSSSSPQIQVEPALDYPLVDTDVEISEPDPEVFEVEPTSITRPVPQNTMHTDIEVSAVHDLAYTCVLIPRLPEHLLTGDLGELLKNSVTRLCLAFGWRLEHLAVTPEYLHWVVNVSPDVSPAKVIRIIREQTSQVIFERNLQLTKENPSGDFWAPGFMVVHGRSITDERLQEFLRQTRSCQGV